MHQLYVCDQYLPEYIVVILEYNLQQIDELCINIKNMLILARLKLFELAQCNNQNKRYLTLTDAFANQIMSSTNFS